VSGSRDLFLDAPGARLRLRDDGSGPPVVFLHGWAFDLDLWEPQVAALAHSHRLIRIDRRGFGLSSGEPSLARDVEDVAFLLERCELEQVVLVGASQGARVALRAARELAGRVAGLVLDAPPDEVSAPEQALTADEVPLAEYRELARAGDVAAVRRAWSRHPFTWLWQGDDAMRALLARVIERYPGRDLLAPQPRPAPLGRELSAITAPALVLNGQHDTLARQAAGELLAGALPNARRVLVPGAGHLPNLDQPRLYQRTLLQFFQESFGGKN
jgi:pimeloyl-ACP methyl ester carboxylesterase